MANSVRCEEKLFFKLSNDNVVKNIIHQTWFHNIYWVKYIHGYIWVVEKRLINVHPQTTKKHAFGFLNKLFYWINESLRSNKIKYISKSNGRGRRRPRPLTFDKDEEIKCTAKMELNINLKIQNLRPNTHAFSISS